MKRIATFVVAAGAALLAASCTIAMAAESASGGAGAPVKLPATYTADNGNGTYSNPLFYEDFPDPDAIRVGNDYYLTGTTMHAMPGLPVLHSKDLVNWELASYCFDKIDLGPAFHMEGGEIYGQGIWAPCIRYHDGMFYVFCNINNFGTQVFRSKSPAGPWEHNRLRTGLHDLSVLFDDDGKVWVVYGSRNLTLAQLNPELTDVVPGSAHVIIRAEQGMGEGSHFYKIKGKYYILSAIAGRNTNVMVGRAAALDGPWEVEKFVDVENMGVPTQRNVRTTGGRGGAPLAFEVVPGEPNAGGGMTLHQGGLVDTPNGEWWSILMSNHGSIGRLTSLVPVTWEKDFPFAGLPGNLRKAPNTWVKPATGVTQEPRPHFVRNDDFNSGKLNPIWQWNHVPEDGKWSLTEKAGVLRLHALAAPDFWMARNSLTQRAIGPESTITVDVDAAGMKSGDVAGLALLSQPFGWVGLEKGDGGLEVRQYDQLTGKTAAEKGAGNHVWLRAHCNFDTELAEFSLSFDGKTFTRIGAPFLMIYQLKTFQGVRYSLFNYHDVAVAGEAGFADFDNVVVEEARAHAAPIPLGKVVTFASVADGNVLAAKGDEVVSVKATKAAVGELWRVVDRGLGRVALQAADGRYISVGTKVSLKAGEPGEAETFQWVNMQQKMDVMLMTLTTHCYLQAVPGELGPVRAALTGPQPDHKEGGCFVVKVVGE